MFIDKDTYNEIATRYFDIEDKETRRCLINLDETEQNQVMSNLASKLYDSIVGKITEIDYGTIANSAGDVTLVENYDKMIECLDVMRSLLSNGQQSTKELETIVKALDNLKIRKDMFTKAYKYEIELPMVVYNMITLACIASISLMISCCVEFIKSPKDESFVLIIDKIKDFQSDKYLLFKNLERFNACCSNGSLDKTLNTIISSKVKNLTGEVVVGVLTGIAITALILSIIPIIRELIFLFYFARVKVSDYFAMQADLLELNSVNIEANSTIDQKKRKAILTKQKNAASNFRKIANTLEVKMKEANDMASKQIKSSDRKLKIQDVTDKAPDSATDSLF